MFFIDFHRCSYILSVLRGQASQLPGQSRASKLATYEQKHKISRPLGVSRRVECIWSCPPAVLKMCSSGEGVGRGVTNPWHLAGSGPPNHAKVYPHKISQSVSQGSQNHSQKSIVEICGSDLTPKWSPVGPGRKSEN